jgi:uncharacterized membrane protein
MAFLIRHLNLHAPRRGRVHGSLRQLSIRHISFACNREGGFIFGADGAVTYGLTLAWAFFGVAIISDTFMAAIEVITSAEREVVRIGKNGERQTFKVLIWNASVANLTLMALGSSAPEILIAIIETVLTLGDTPGEIGPSTIVGTTFLVYK